MINRNAGDNAAQMTFDEALQSVQDEIKHTLTNCPVIVKRYARHLLGGQGKHIRATALLACALNGENRIQAPAVQFATATEILHLATLVHDDVIDDADVRRGLPSLQKKFGKGAAVICGDYLFSVALSLAASVPYKEDYHKYNMPGYIAQVCYGALSEHINSGNLDLSAFEYLKIISGKTAALFESSFFIGASLSECGQENVAQYRRLGWYTGMIFQLLDDCNDFESTRKMVKKPVHSDFEHGVITLPLIYTFAACQDFKKKIQSKNITRAEINQAVGDCGGLEHTHQVAGKLFEKAERILQKLSPEQEKRDRLRAILKRAAQLQDA